MLTGGAFCGLGPQRLLEIGYQIVLVLDADREAHDVGAGAGPDVVRLSIGIEDKDDIIADLDEALSG